MENKNRRLEKSVPEDLVADILSRLPAKDLVRFTCVSKSWCSFIRTDPCFHRLQAQRTAPPNPFLWIETRVRTKTGANYWSFNNHWVGLDSIEGYSHSIFDLASIEGYSINNPFEGPCCDTQVLGVCHGLLLHQQQGSLKTAVSNPTTKRHVMLPPSPAGDVNALFCGFGYDHIHDCYKVVTKVHQRLALMVYDLNKGAWRRFRFGAWWRSQYGELDGFDSRLDDDRVLNLCWNGSAVECVDGGVYWCIGINEIPRVMLTIVCFLLAEEEFHVVEPPDLGEVMYYPNLTVLDERLCLVCQGLDTRHEVWGSTGVDCGDDGKRQWRWTKLFAISDPFVMLPSRSATNGDALIPVCFSASGSEIMFCVGSDQLFWYDLEKNEFRKFSNLMNCLMVTPCVSRMGDLGFLLKNRLG